MDGFVRSPSGAAAMGYWGATDLPFYYGLAETFPLCDRWFASCLGQTYANRRFLLCGSALGSINTILQTDLPAPANGTIVEALNRHGISWRDYYTTLPSLLLFPPVFTANQDKCVKVERFFTDAATGELPSFCLVEPNSQAQTEEAPQDISLGEAFTARVVNAIMRSAAWPRSVLVLCYDEHGGYYDHVPPRSRWSPTTSPRSCACTPEITWTAWPAM
jgi:phospholipase C